MAREIDRWCAAMSEAGYPVTPINGDRWRPLPPLTIEAIVKDPGFWRASWKANQIAAGGTFAEWTCEAHYVETALRYEGRIPTRTVCECLR